jgi:hypothetical protein
MAGEAEQSQGFHAKRLTGIREIDLRLKSTIGIQQILGSAQANAGQHALSV